MTHPILTDPELQEALTEYAEVVERETAIQTAIEQATASIEAHEQAAKAERERRELLRNDLSRLLGDKVIRVHRALANAARKARAQ